MNDQIPINTKIAASDTIKIEPFDVTKRYTKPHKHNKYLELVYFTKGSGFHYLDSKPLAINPPVAFLIRKDQVHHWHIDTKPKGYVIIIKETFLEQISDAPTRVQLNALNNVEEINIPRNDKVLPSLFKALSFEMKEAQLNTEIIENGLKAIFSKLIRFSNYSTFGNTHSIAQKFLQLLSETLKNSVAYYAEKLSTSPQNLNAICKKTYNKTASEVIAQFIIKEAKRQLVYTSKNISEIAFDMEFKDTSNFTKFFKRHTGTTPLKFRKASH
ncbi:MAG: AraC family transcriptional regulator [Flavobacteriaceae bacterium]